MYNSGTMSDAIAPTLGLYWNMLPLCGTQIWPVIKQTFSNRYKDNALALCFLTPVMRTHSRLRGFHNHSGLQGFQRCRSVALHSAWTLLIDFSAVKSLATGYHPKEAAAIRKPCTTTTNWIRFPLKQKDSINVPLHTWSSCSTWILLNF